MNRLTFVCEDGTILFHPEWLQEDEGFTITELAKGGRFDDLEQIAEALVNVEQRLEKYLDTNLIPEQLLEIDKMYSEKCREVAELRADLKAYKDTGIPLEDNTKLKPCPFCGSHDVDVVIYSDDGTLEPAGEDEAPAFVRCWGCDMDYFPNTDIQGKVMEAWNRRLKDE